MIVSPTLKHPTARSATQKNRSGFVRDRQALPIQPFQDETASSAAQGHATPQECLWPTYAAGCGINGTGRLAVLHEGRVAVLGLPSSPGGGGRSWLGGPFQL